MRDVTSLVPRDVTSLGDVTISRAVMGRGGDSGTGARRVRDERGRDEQADVTNKRT